MSLEYAPRGLVGMLTPQANTTVEPEFNLLWPGGIAMINARLMSDKSSMAARLAEYFDQYGAGLRQFANAPVSVVAAACTGASYLAGREREATLVQELTKQSGHPTLGPIASSIGWDGAPVMSCNLCLAWRVVEAL